MSCGNCETCICENVELVAWKDHVENQEELVVSENVELHAVKQYMEEIHG